jgi:hypothetical protein
MEFFNQALRHGEPVSARASMVVDGIERAAHRFLGAFYIRRSECGSLQLAFGAERADGSGRDASECETDIRRLPRRIA